MQKAWVERILELCREERVAFFFKQWGGVRKANAGRRLNNRTYDEMPLAQTHSMLAKHVRVSAAAKWQARSRHWTRAAADHNPFPLLRELAI
jgi:hypothetical protein